jgi:hypothetical protein
MIIRLQHTAEASLENVRTPSLESSAWTLADPAAPGLSTRAKRKRKANYPSLLSHTKLFFAVSAAN